MREHMNDRICISGRMAGAGQPPYVIAELSANHNGSLERALATVEAAARVGANAIKLQTYTADTLTIDHDGPGFCIESGLWEGRTLYELYKEAHLPWDWHEALFKKGHELGIAVFSSPFDDTAVDFLEELGCPAYKIASFEIVDLQLIRKAASTGKPLIISTGMANEAETAEAVQAAREGGCKQLVLLHCISGYPTAPEDANLLTIPDMAQRFNIPVGLSDHTPGTTVAVAAVALGACVIEKHFTLSRADGGPDSSFSLEPGELKQLCRDAATAWQAMGRASYEHKESEKDNVIFRRSLYAIEDIRAGQTFTVKNVRSIRPGFGLAPKHLSEIVGQHATCDIARGTPLGWTLVTRSQTTPDGT